MPWQCMAWDLDGFRLVCRFFGGKAEWFMEAITGTLVFTGKAVRDVNPVNVGNLHNW